MQYQCNSCHHLNPVSYDAPDYLKCLFCAHDQQVPEEPWLPGSVLGFRYAVVQILGKGGHGFVCMCRDLLEDRICVLKIFHRADLKKEVIDSYYNEAQKARDFVHPNIVRTYGGGIDGRVLYIVQDWICGLNLVRYEKKIGRFTLNQLMVIMLKCCRALNYMWEGFNLIHRDIKPENVIVNHKGEVFLTDFGIMSGPIEKEESTQLFCTPEYVSPEAVSGEEAVDFRSDIYSLGASFFRLISGYDPFKGKDNTETIMKRFAGIVPDLRSYTDVTQELAFLIYKMMGMSPADRFQSYEVLIQQVEYTINMLNKDTQFYIQGLEDLPNVQ